MQLRRDERAKPARIFEPLSNLETARAAGEAPGGGASFRGRGREHAWRGGAAVSPALALVLAACTAPSEPGGPASVRPSGHPPRVMLAPSANDLQAGFGRTVVLPAPIVSDPDGDAVTVRWELASWEDALDAPPALEPRAGGAVAVTTPALGALGIGRATPGPLEIPRARRGRLLVRAVADDGTHRVAAEWTIAAAEAAPGWPRAPLGIDYWVSCGSGASARWVLAERAPGSTAALDDAASCATRLRPDAPGRYVLRDEASGAEVAFLAGTWLGTAKCSTVDCHPAIARAWSETAHSRAWEDLHSGRRGAVSGECLGCHTVGFAPAAINGGHDDHPDREDLRDVGCESCHAPAKFYRSLAASICAQCHDGPSSAAVASAWARSAHARPNARGGEGARCGACHSGQGAVVRATLFVDTASADPEDRITCAACHASHGPHFEKDLRVFGTVWIAGPRAVEAGRAAGCVSCHEADGDRVVHRAHGTLPHAAAESDVYFGLGDLDEPPRPSPHVAEGLDCVSCHMAGNGTPGSGHAMVATVDGCAGCHADGEALLRSDAARVAAALARARAALSPPAGAAAVPRAGPAAGDPLERARFFVALVAADPGAAAHNPAFAVFVLERALADATSAR